MEDPLSPSSSIIVQDGVEIDGNALIITVANDNNKKNLQTTVYNEYGQIEYVNVYIKGVSDLGMPIDMVIMSKLTLLVLEDCLDMKQFSCMSSSTNKKLQVEILGCNKIVSIDNLERAKAAIFDNSSLTPLKCLPTIAGNENILKEIEIRECRLDESVLTALSTFPHLDVFIINNCTINENHVFKMNSLTTFYIHNMDITTVNSSIFSLPLLDMLFISNCRNIKTIDAGDGSVTLKTLVIKDCSELSMIPEFTLMSRLRSLEIKNCPKVESIPSTIFKATLLNDIDLNNVGIKSIPYQIHQLGNLLALRIQKCNNLLEFPYPEHIPSIIRAEIDVVIRWNENLVTVRGLTDCFEKFNYSNIKDNPILEIHLPSEVALKNKHAADIIRQESEYIKMKKERITEIFKRVNETSLRMLLDIHNMGIKLNNFHRARYIYERAQRDDNQHDTDQIYVLYNDMNSERTESIRLNEKIKKGMEKLDDVGNEIDRIISKIEKSYKKMVEASEKMEEAAPEKAEQYEEMVKEASSIRIQTKPITEVIRDVATQVHTNYDHATEDLDIDDLYAVTG